MTTNIVACIDGSAYADYVCSAAAWAASQLNERISLLHVVAPYSDHHAGSDLSGAIGLGAKSDLLHKLTLLEEEQGKIQQQRGRIILDHAKELLAHYDITDIDVLHRRGTLVDAMLEYEDTSNLIIMGRRGEHAKGATQHLGSNLERVARSIHTPLLVTGMKVDSVERVVLCYDGSPTMDKVLEYLKQSPLLHGVHIRVLHICEKRDGVTDAVHHAAQTLQAAGYDVLVDVQEQPSIEQAVEQCVAQHDIDMLIIGAYGHSRFRSLLLGSTTTALLGQMKLPTLLFRVNTQLQS